ncbi:MAG: OmpA family protein [Deferribacterales bacterium]
MFKKTFLIMCLLLVSMVSFAFEEYPLFNTLENYSLNEKLSKSFDYGDNAFVVGKSKKQTVEGRYYKMVYSLDKQATPMGKLYIIRNYTNAIQNAGGTIVYVPSSNELVTGKILKNGKEIWVGVHSSNVKGTQYSVTIVEKAGMNQEIEANGLLDSINKTGRVTLYLNFETGSFFIQQDSYQTLYDIAEMMRQSPGLRVAIEGHTDNTGSPDGNQRLSEVRAKMIKYSLEIMGIDPSRMKSAGYGRTRPVADNGTEEGRAKNRRVELVKIN